MLRRTTIVVSLGLFLGMELMVAGMASAKGTKSEAKGVHILPVEETQMVVEGQETATVKTISKSCTCKRFIGNIQSKEEIREKIHQLIKQLDCPRSFYRERAIILLGQSEDPQAVKPLINIALDNNKNSRDRQGAIEALERLTRNRDKILTSKEISEEYIALTLRKIFKDENKGVQLSAAKVLYKLGGTSTVIPILEDLAKQGQVSVLHIFSKVTKEGEIIYDENARSFYIKSLQYDNDEIRAAATFHLVKMGEKKIAYTVAIDILKNSKKKWARYSAINTLKEIGDEKSKIAIESALKDEEGLVRNYAKKVLAEMEKNK